VEKKKKKKTGGKKKGGNHQFREGRRKLGERERVLSLRVLFHKKGKKDGI